MLSTHDVYAHLYYIHPWISCCLFYYFKFFFCWYTPYKSIYPSLLYWTHTAHVHKRTLSYHLLLYTKKKRGEGENFLEYVPSTAHKHIHTAQEVVIPELFIGWYFISESENTSALKTDEWLSKTKLPFCRQFNCFTKKHARIRSEASWNWLRNDKQSE